MNDERSNLPPQEEESIRDVLRSLERVDADAEFQRRLRADFTSGRIAKSAPRQGRGSLVPFPVAPTWGWAAAAVVVLAVFAGLMGTIRRSSWEVLATHGTGDVVVQGVVIPVTDTGGLAARLVAGGRIETQGAVELDLQGGEALALGLAPGTAIEVERPPARWFGRGTQVHLSHGELRIVTGPDFPGARLVVHTPEGMVRITGTAVAVYRDSTVTCVCVLEGTAAIGNDAEHLDEVPAGKRKVMFADARDPMILDIEPQHRQDLQSFVERSRPRFRAP